jgi:hypothetical protein
LAGLPFFIWLSLVTFRPSLADDLYGIIVAELERIASSTHNTSTTLSVPISGAGPRHASGGEVAYLKRLVDKYGTDVEQMARDRKVGLSDVGLLGLSNLGLAERGAEDSGPIDSESKEMRIRSAIVIALSRISLYRPRMI